MRTYGVVTENRPFFYTGPNCPENRWRAHRFSRPAWSCASG